ncbi:MAG: hypothetical protein KAT91_04760 [Candidatus Aenigmarchaeota archaeon]|nr:hypothetical protein [Candidatus Aenigmarchaeota archaeon]
MSEIIEEVRTYICDLCGEEIELKHPYEGKGKHFCSNCFDALKDWINEYE